MLDIVISGSLAVLPSGSEPADIGRDTFTGDLEDGQFLARKIPEEIRIRPVV
jgi:hypothetical protein